VYEPDESPDGFPLEYGNIIVGLPKQSADSDGDESAEPQGAGRHAADVSVEQDATTVNDADPAPADAEQADAKAVGKPKSKNKSKAGAQANTQAVEGTPAPTNEAEASSSKTSAPEPAAGSSDEAVSGEAAAEQEDNPQPTSSDDASQADSTQDGPTDDGAAQDGSSEDGPAQDSSSDDGPAEDDLTQAAVAQEDSTQDASGDDGSVQDDGSQDGSADDSSAQAEPTSDGGESVEGVQGDGEQTDGTQTDRTQADAQDGAEEGAAEAVAESSGDVVLGEVAADQEDGTQDASVDGGSAQDDGRQDASTDGGSAQDDGTQGVSTDDGSAQGDVARSGSAQDDPAQGASAQEDSTQDGSADGGSAQDGPVSGGGESGGAGQDDGEQAGDATAVSGSEADGPDGAQVVRESYADGEQTDGAQADARDGAEEGAAETTAESSGGGSAEDEGGEGDSAEADGGAEELTAAELGERLAAEQAAMALITALMKLRGALAGSALPLDVVGAAEARQQQKAMLDQLDDYLLPRLVQLDAPVLAVVGGSTGAGKSTLVNSVIGKVVSEPGVLRPTTRSPVLIHHPDDADWFVGDRVLPGMARTSADSPGGTEDQGQLRLVAADTVPRGLAILDAPDIDSVVEANRDLATQLLSAADLWLFVTTAARYSDAVPWDFLQSASDRSTAVAVVLDRAPRETIDDITGHLAQMLLERGLGDSPLFSIQETVVDGNGMLPSETVASIKDWLVDLAADAEARVAVVRRTLQGAVGAMVKTTAPFAIAVRAQAETALELRSTAESAYDQAVQDIAKSTQDGTLLRGEVLARWQEFVGTGELLKGLQSGAGRLRDKAKKSVGTKPTETRSVNDAIESGLESLLREQAAAAAERAEKAWQSSAAGRQLLAIGGPELGAMSEDFPDAAGRAVREWQKSVLELVRREGADKRSTARILEYGVNGLGLSLMVVIFASGAGIPKAAEASVGVGSAVVGQKLLEAVFGDTAVRTLVEKAREDLDGKVHALMDAEFARYLAVLDQHPVDPETARHLTEAARAVEDCT
jgi:hypothetical protein